MKHNYSKPLMGMCMSISSGVQCLFCIIWIQVQYEMPFNDLQWLHGMSAVPVGRSEDASTFYFQCCRIICERIWN
jgi:hypothetical protein